MSNKAVEYDLISRHDLSATKPFTVHLGMFSTTNLPVIHYVYYRYNDNEQRCGSGYLQVPDSIQQVILNFLYHLTLQLLIFF
jgi:hypothetical protein